MSELEEMREHNGVRPREDADAVFEAYRTEFARRHGFPSGIEGAVEINKPKNAHILAEWRREYRNNTLQWCGSCRGYHIPTKEHPVCRLCTFGIHAPAPDDIYFHYRGWKFTPPFICMLCGIEICFHQWAFSRSCGPCDCSESKTRRLLYRKCFAGPHEKLPIWGEGRGDIEEDHFVDPAKREEYPIMRISKEPRPIPPKPLPRPLPRPIPRPKPGPFERHPLPPAPRGSRH